jgi:hypothetical protein
MPHTLILPIPLDITTSDTAVSTVDITSGIDDTYSVYEFHFVNMVPSTNASILAFQVDVGTDTDYDQQITSTTIETEHDEGDSGAALQYRTNRDQANGTNYQQLGEYIYDDGDTSGSGILTLYAPSSGTYVKHWISTFNAYGNATPQTSYHAGYINTATAITRIRFVMVNNAMAAQGDIKAGTIKMYGVT